MNLPDTTTAYFWPGLAPYQEHDRHLFYGRGDEIFDLSRKVISSRLAILFGPSGAGKTSLLQAGVFPKLREQNLLPVPIRLDFPKPGELIIPVINQIERSLQREAAKQGVSIDPVVNNWFAERKSLLSLWEWLRSFTLTDSSGQTWTPVFIFDQFEEIFTLGKHALGLESFLHQLGDAAENFLPGEINHLIDEEKSELPFNPAEQPYKMVIALREDYFAQLQSLRQILPGVTVRQNHFSLIRLIGTQALEAITGPAPSGMITNQVATEIIHFVANASERTEQDNPNSSQSLDQFEVEPAILSLVCQQLDLKRQAQDQTSITVDFVKQSKGQILEEFYESAMKPVQTETRYYIENQLLDAEGFRTSEPESNLARQLIPPEDIQLLINLRLLHRVEHYQRSHLELSHDVLAPVVKTIRDSRLQREDLEKRKAENTLLRKQRRRSMVLVGSFGIITLLALVAVFFGMQKQKQALRLEKESRIKYFLSESNRLLETNKPLAEAFTANAFLENDQKANPDLMRNVLSQINHPLFNYRESNVIGDYSRFISPEGYGKLYGITNYGSIVEITNNGIPINEILFNNEIILTAFFEKGTIKSLLTSATAPPYKLYMRTHSGEKIRDWDFEPTFLRKRYGIGYSTPLQSSAKVKMSNRDGTKIFISNYTSYWYLNLTGGTFQRLKNSEIVDHVLIEPKPLFFNGEACLFYGDTIIFPDRSDWK
ncbi:MAG: hypothetical protein NTV01_18280, partial [Bacteroidia bacterium]|nr:hypothetical protein [Bacteroidia bacterium]